MARKSTKTAENTAQSIADALDTPLNLDWDITAENLNTTIPELQERLAAKLDDTVFTWANIPVEYQPMVEAIARDLESEASVRRFDIPSEPAAELPPIIEAQPKQSSAITESAPNELTSGINQDLQETDRLNNETIELQELLYAAEADDKAQLAASVKSHGWQIYQRVGAEIDINTILEIAQSKLNNADNTTNSRLSALASQLNVRTPDQIRTATEERKQAFLQQQQTRTTAWQSATSLATSKA